MSAQRNVGGRLRPGPRSRRVRAPRRRSGAAVCRTLLCSLALTALGTGPVSCERELEPPRPIRAERIAAGLSSPVFVTAPRRDRRLFVLETSTSKIRIVHRGNLLPEPFLDLSDRVAPFGEGGLLGMAFDPDYRRTGHFYLYYLTLRSDAQGETHALSVLSRFRRSTDPDRGDPDSEEILLEVEQTLFNQKGGTVAFSPIDGFLYWGLGDGGGRNDPLDRAQDAQSLLGKLLRIDVRSGPGPDAPYRIPPDNPYVDDPDVLDEIWALGLRNPYRFSFDRRTGDLWIGDVGEGLREEIDFEPAGDPGGRNYGWDVMEGALCNPAGAATAPPCNDASLVPPILEYPHIQGGCGGSVIGGNVYRGPFRSLRGLYFFGDFCTGQIWSFDRSRNALVDRSAEILPSDPDGPHIDTIVGFGENGFGELFVVDFDGDIFRLRPELRERRGKRLGERFREHLGRRLRALFDRSRGRDG